MRHIGIRKNRQKKEMLSRLQIKNYALIDDLTLELGDGLSIITGETGAGKSIMLGALTLLLGGRADTKAITDKTSKTVVEAIFTSAEGEETIVRREISPTGRSRGFVDDSPVTLPLLEATTAGLLDIHSQNANLKLNSREGQLAIIDAYGGNQELAADYRKTYREFAASRSKVKSLRAENERSREARELIEYQLEILDKLNPRPGEMEEIERRYEMLSEADTIREGLQGAYNALDGEDGALQQIRRAVEMLSGVNIQLVDPEADTENGVFARLRSAYIELKDISETLAGFASGVEADPAALAKTGARMNALYETARKLKAGDGDGLVELHNALRKKLQRLSTEESDVEELEQESRRLAQLLKKKGVELSERRKAGARRFSEELESKARPLGLHNLHFEVGIEHGKLGADGGDNIEFLCAFNKNGVLMPMSRTASGGELSRLTLAIKSIMAEKMEMPTIIFDEIDTGVSGEIADKMGRMMACMSRKMQIIAITHLPQVAAQGDRHYKVYKEDRTDRTVSSVRELNGGEREREIAGMISGSEVTEAALRAAEALLKQKN